MKIIATKIKHEIEARTMLKKGIKEIYDLVASTLGPYGRNNIIEKKASAPQMTNDGFYTIRSVILENETEDLGSQAIADVAWQQNKEVGDGTTTAVVLAYNLIERIFDRMDKIKDNWDKKKENVMAKRREIIDNIPKIVAEIKKMSQPIKTKEDIEKIAFTSLEDEKLAKVVAGMVHKMGKDGSISVEEGYGQEIETSVISGYKFLGKYLDDKMATNDRREAIIKEPLIIITNEFIETPATLKVIVDWLMKNHGKREVVLIAEGFSTDVSSIIVRNKENKIFNCLAVKAGSLTTGVYEDLAFYTGGQFFNKNIGKSLTESATIKPGIGITDFGKARKIVVDREKTFIIEGGGKSGIIKERVKELKSEKEIERHPDLKKNIEKRISALTGGVGLIEIATKSDIETEYLIAKMEDTISACKAAMEEGMVKGGGLTLKEIAEKLPENILTETLKHPYELIQENAGGKLKIEDDILDPTKVVRMSVEHAFAFAAIFITIEHSIAWNRNPVEETLAEILRQTFQEVMTKNRTIR